MLKKTLDKDLRRVVQLEQAIQGTGRWYALLGAAGLFLGLVWLFALQQSAGIAGGGFVVLAAIVGGYMALNIGANDVANNMAPAVGARAVTMAGAIAIAAVCEAAGAILAGGDVVTTIKGGIIDPGRIGDGRSFIWIMIGALLAAALWINLATWLNAPVSTTHAIVGGVLGGGLAAAGMGAVDWRVTGTIAASWVISPLLGGLIAALFLDLCRRLILDAQDRLAAALRWVPVLIGIMAAAFAAYLMIKGLKQVWRPGSGSVIGLALACGLFAYFAVRPLVARGAIGLNQRKKSVAQLFMAPLIVSAGLLSFAHGANDVANAVGPLAAVVETVRSGAIAGKAAVPLWVMLVGAAGLSLGLTLFGPKLIRTVGEQITRLNPMRAFCVALSAAITVIAASALGLPVSSTHIAVGGIFGVGLYREWREHRRRHVPTSEVLLSLIGSEPVEIAPDLPPEKQAKKRAKAARRKLVRRSHALTIGAAWVITVPAAALLSAALFLLQQEVFGG